MKKLALATVLILAASPLFAQGRGRGAAPAPVGIDIKAVLADASKAMGVDKVNSIQYSGSGTNNNFGQQDAPNHPWPTAKLTGYVMTIDYKAPALHLQFLRSNPDGPAKGGGFPILTPAQTNHTFVGTYAWNQNANAAAGQPAAAPAPNAVNGDLLQIWTSPHGAIKAAQQALANNGVTAVQQGTDRILSFWVAGQLVRAAIGADDTVNRVEWTTDNAVLGDTTTVTTYLYYKDRGNGVMFPTRIHQTQGGFATFDLPVADVKVNAPLAADVPQNVKDFKAPAAAAPTVDMQKVADGVYYITGGTHHSVAVEFSDHIVLVEAPLNEARVNMVVDAVKKQFPNKPIRYVVNTHDHFDHLGGVRTAAAMGYTIITQRANSYVYPRLLAGPHTVDWDLMTRLGKDPKESFKFETVDDKRVLKDATRELQLIRVPTDHSESMLVGYLPKERILIEADLFNPPAANAPAPATPAPINPVTVALYDSIQKMNLLVTTILPLHGRQVTMQDLRLAAGKPAVAAAKPAAH